MKRSSRQPRTTVVIVTYRSMGVVNRALEALEPIARGGAVACTVVDNASDDGTAAYVREEHPWVRLLEGRGNVGFGRGCNAGLARAETEFVLFLNPDAVISYESLLTLERFFDEHDGAGLIAPAVAFEDGGYQPVRPLPTPLGVLAGEGGFALGSTEQIPVWPGAEPFPVEWLCGAVLMGRRQLLDDLDGFDPRFFMYFEETDLCVRARQAGAELWMVPGAEASHTSGASAERSDARLWSGCIAEYYFESRHYYLTKHYGRLAACGATLGEIALMAARTLLDRVRGRGSSRLQYRLKAPVLRLPAHLG